MQFIHLTFVRISALTRTYIHTFGGFSTGTAGVGAAIYYVYFGSQNIWNVYMYIALGVETVTKDEMYKGSHFLPITAF